MLRGDIFAELKTEILFANIYIKNHHVHVHVYVLSNAVIQLCCYSHLSKGMEISMWASAFSMCTEKYVMDFKHVLLP